MEIVNKQGTDVFPPLPEELNSRFPVDHAQVSGFRRLSAAAVTRVARCLFFPCRTAREYWMMGKKRTFIDNCDRCVASSLYWQISPASKAKRLLTMRCFTLHVVFF